MSVSWRKRLLVLAVCALFLLSGCMQTGPSEKQAASATLPPFSAGPDAPKGDGREEQDFSTVLYLPNADGTVLESKSVFVTAASGQTKQQAVMEAFLRMVNLSDFWKSSQVLALAAEAYPVQVMGNVTVVSLNTAARMLTPQDFFALRMAITNTLTALGDTEAVQVLINGRETGLDVAMTLPCGALTRFPTGEISAYWRQIENQLELEESLRKMVVLYFPSMDGTVLVGETRTLIMHESSITAYVEAVLQALAEGPVKLECAKAAMPAQNILSAPPLVLVPSGSSSKYVELYFSSDVEGYLAQNGIEWGELLSSLCYTITGFLPGVDGIIAYVNEEPITEVMLPGDILWASANGRMIREELAGCVGGIAVIDLPSQEGETLCRVQRPIAQRYVTSPRAMLRELLREPPEAGTSRGIPEVITDADILAIQIREGCALVNLSERFAAVGCTLSDTDQRNMIYSIVNTLTELDGVNSVRFYVADYPEKLMEVLDLRGVFLRHPGLLKNQ